MDRPQNLFDHGLDPKTLGIYLRALLDGETAQLQSLSRNIRSQLGIAAPFNELSPNQKDLFKELDDYSFAFKDSEVTLDKEDLIRDLLLGDEDDTAADDDDQPEAGEILVEAPDDANSARVQEPEENASESEVDEPHAQVVPLRVPVQSEFTEDASQCAAGGQ